MVAFRNTDPSGRTTGLLLRCVLYSILALTLIVVDKRYDHLAHIRRYLSIVAYPVQIAVASPFAGWDWFRESVTTRDALRADKARLEAELRLAQFRLQRYAALEAGLGKVATEALRLGASAHMPRLGCGLAGGKWEVVGPLVETALCGAGVAVTVYDYEG